MGYFRAGFTEIVGVDIKPQPRYPFTFVQGDATNPPVDLSKFDAIHASPPCQAYSTTQSIYDRDHPRLLDAVRALLIQAGLPYVIENVEGAPLLNPIMLCGQMFDLPVYRHRLFESQPPTPPPPARWLTFFFVKTKLRRPLGSG
jgi:DNA (cytosine-5)-methyltransferase 1